MHVLLIFEQRAVQWRDQLSRVLLVQYLGADVFVEQQLEPVEGPTRSAFYRKAPIEFYWSQRYISPRGRG